MLKSMILFVTVFVLTFSFSFTATAKTDVKLVTGEWSPFTSQAVEGKGFFTEIVTATLSELGIDHKIDFYPWKRCSFMVEKGKAFAAFPYSYSPERAKQFNFSDTVAYSTSVFFYYKPKMASFTYQDLKSLKNYKIGGVGGYFYEKDFKTANLKVQWVSKEVSNLRKLVAGRIQITPLNELVGWELIKKTYPDKWQDFATASKPLLNSDLRLMVSRSYPESAQLMAKFNEGLKRIKSKGIIQKIYKKYNLTVRD